jgi:hypothetical protein
MELETRQKVQAVHNFLRPLMIVYVEAITEESHQVTAY